MSKESENTVNGKLCNQCRVVRPLSDYYKAGKKKDTGEAKLNGKCRYCLAVEFRSDRHRYSWAKTRCKVEGFEWDMTFEQFADVQKHPCHYCGGPLSSTGMAMDRIDPEGPYRVGNVNPCCPLCNDIKGLTFRPEEMKRFGQVLAEIRAERIASGETIPIKRSLSQRLKCGYEAIKIPPECWKAYGLEPKR